MFPRSDSQAEGEASTDHRAPPTPETIPPVDHHEGPSFIAMIALVAIVVATVILVFFGIGYGIGRMFL